MSILIKGIDMPKDETCMLIRVKYNENGKPCVFVISDRGERLLGEIQSVPTPHGDLVDRKWLKKLWTATDNRLYISAESVIDLDNAPTVIEAEE